jgi:hypothetical protein
MTNAGITIEPPRISPDNFLEQRQATKLQATEQTIWFRTVGDGGNDNDVNIAIAPSTMQTAAEAGELTRRLITAFKEAKVILSRLRFASKRADAKKAPEAPFRELVTRNQREFPLK